MAGSLSGLLPSGAVLGLDVGYSPTSRTSAACCLEWSENKAAIRIERFAYSESERQRAILNVVKGKPLMAAAFDGPLNSGLEEIGVYRLSEAMLTSGLQAFVGKPGQSSSPNGKRLNAAANEAARTALALCDVGPAQHAVAIHQKCIAEAFPTTFLGVLFRDRPSGAWPKRQKSDIFFELHGVSGVLSHFLDFYLPGRRVVPEPAKLTNHDDRAGYVCALTALAVAAGKITAVGCHDHGWIILPPRELMGAWAWDLLEQAAKRRGAACLVEVG